jgi:hypothetical protein
MAWRIESRADAGKWVEYDGAEWTADPDTRDLVLILREGPQPLTPVGPFYEPKGPDDEAALYLAALSAVPAPSVDGEAPELPKLPPPVGGNAVY